MNIAVDIDDTLVNTFEYFMPFVSEYFNVPLDYLEKNDISYDNTPPEWNMDMEAFAHVYFDRYVPATPPKKGAKEALEELRRRGHRIIIVTHRNNRLYKDCYKTTEEELHNCGFQYDDLICTDEKGPACQNAGIGLLIDDTVSNCDEVSSLGIPVILFTSRANSSSNAGYKRVSCWDEILALPELSV